MSARERMQQQQQYITRFDINQRIQHLTLIVTFTMLAVTGLPMMFHESAASQWWVGLWGGIEVTRVVHRFAAGAFIGVLLYHLVYIVWRVYFKKQPMAGLAKIMLPGIKDVRGLTGMFGHYLGLIKRGPKWGRYDMMQKLEYWAAVWGLLIMVATGFINWFPVTVTKFAPGFIIPLAKSIHGWEAVLAVFWVLLVHLYSVVWSRRVFPFDRSIWNGKISLERLREEHPLEHERSVAARAKQGPNEQRNE